MLCDFRKSCPFVFEMLGLFEEALIQYDEIDALLTQLVINSNFGGKYHQILWLEHFSHGKVLVCTYPPERSIAPYFSLKFI